ncbi:MAG TPA: ATP-dependent helicase, partial [bacterium]|nr:ATP-dependent helicase [bacterium]
EVYRRYQGALRRRSQVDFDDQVLETTMLFVREPGALQAVRRQFRYLFVDEFQDINRAQWELVQVLAGDPMADDRTYLCCVGDDDQSIYGFRGAHPDFVGEFSRRYEPRTVVLEDNYRSGRPILEVANRLLREKSWGATKTLRPTAPGDFKPRVLLGLDPDDEAAQVAAEIGKLAAAGVPLREIAVLYRQNAQSRPFEEVLLRRQVEHVVVGGLGFYQRPEVQQALAFLRLAWDDHDHEALTQAAQVTLRYLKRDLRHEFLHAVEQQGIGVLELPKHLGSLPELPPYGTRAARELAELIKELQGMRRRQPLPVLLDEALAKGGLRKVLESGTRQEDEDKLENLDELRAALASFNAQHPGAGIAEFLGEVQGKAGKPRRDDEAVEGVRLMTLHKAKGLEFRAVFLAGLEEKRLPHARSIEEGNLAEELRLLYVGVTRAKERLYLSAAEVRYAGPNDAPRPVLPSRFLQQLAPELLEGEKDAVEHLLGLRTRATAKDRMVAKAVAQSKPSPKPPTT